MDYGGSILSWRTGKTPECSWYLSWALKNEILRWRVGEGLSEKRKELV